MQKSDNLEELTRKQLYQIYLDEEVGDVSLRLKLWDPTNLVVSKPR